MQKKQRRLTAYLYISLAGIPAAHADPLVADDTIVVTPKKKSMLVPDYRQEKEKLEAVAGGTNLIEIEQDTRQATLHDALDYQPGVIVQNFFGGIDQPRLNIRGSGVQSAPLSRGVLLMQDGLPVTDADGSFHISTLEMRDARMVSVRRGANSLSAQSNTLGGELDLLSWTGRDERGRLRYEYGSYGREGLQAALGGVTDDGRFDGRVNFTYDHFDGYRKHSTSQRKTMRSNLGYVSDNFENRTWLSWTDLRFDVPGPLSETALNDDPTDAYPMVWPRDPHRNIEQLRIANRSSWQIDNQHIGVGAWYLRTHDNFIAPSSYRLSQSHSEGLQLTWNMETEPASWRTAVVLDRMDLKRTLLQNRKETPSADKRFIGLFDGVAQNFYGSAGVGIHLKYDLTLNLDLKGTLAQRDVERRDGSNSLDQHWNFWTPKVGIIWQPQYNQRYFANVSASKEPATFLEIINSSSGELTKLEPQSAVTFEVGGEGEFTDSLKWDVTLYRSLVKNEYITIYDSAGNAISVLNYNAKTRHQGIEAGLRGLIPAGSGNLEYRLSWTYNDFRFMGGDYKGNYIAGIPRNLIASEVLYRIGDWSFGPNLHWAPTDMAVDHGNHLDIQKRERYAVLGFKGSYQPEKGSWSAYLSVDNLTRERYASTSVAQRDVTENDSTLYPGTDLSINGGVTWRF